MLYLPKHERVTIGEKAKSLGYSYNYPLFADRQLIGYWHDDCVSYGIHSNSHITLNKYGESLGLKVPYRTEYLYDARRLIERQLPPIEKE